MEQYLLSLYRRAFDQEVTSASPSKRDKTVGSHVETPRGSFLDGSTPRLNALSNREHGMVQSARQPLNEPSKNGTGTEQNRLGLQINRCQSALPQSSGFAAKSSPPADGSPRALRACHSETFPVAEASFRPSIPFLLLKNGTVTLMIFSCFSSVCRERCAKCAQFSRTSWGPYLRSCPRNTQ